MSKSAQNRTKNKKLKREQQSPLPSSSVVPSDQQRQEPVPPRSIPSPVYFISLKVSNLRCFGPDPQTLKLSDTNNNWSRWTIILGNNGTGKSTLLQVLASVYTYNLERLERSLGAMRESQEPRDPDMPKEGVGIHPQFSMWVVQSGFRKAAIDAAKRQSRQESPHAIHIEIGLNMVGADEKIDAVPILKATWTINRGDDDGEIELKGQTGAIAIPKTTPKLVCAAYGAWRRLGNSTIARNEHEEAFESRAHLFNETANLINAEEWFLRLDFASSKMSAESSNYATMFAQVKEALKSLLPNVRDIRTNLSGNRKVDPRVEFLTDFGWVQLRQLGYGYQSLISWVVDFAARMFEEYPDSENPLGEPAVCLVDEIDLHLHPSWQRKVMQYLSGLFPKTQFIATAHSPLIVQAAPDVGANVVVLRQVKDHVEICNDPIDVRGWRADQILASELFDEVPLRSKDVQAAMNERIQLLSKPTLTETENVRVKELNDVVESLPVGSSPDERDLTSRLKEAVDLLGRMEANVP